VVENSSSLFQTSKKIRTFYLGRAICSLFQTSKKIRTFYLGWAICSE